VLNGLMEPSPETLPQLLLAQAERWGNRRVAIREFASVAGVPARSPHNVLGEHEALDRRQVPDEVAERELSGRISPFEPIGGGYNQSRVGFARGCSRSSPGTVRSP